MGFMKSLIFKDLEIFLSDSIDLNFNVIKLIEN